MAIKLVLSRSIGWNFQLSRYRKEAVDYTIIENGADCYPWTETFVIWPRRSIGGTPLFWTRAYKRKVWVIWGRGFHMEPEVQYATIFDILSGKDQTLA